MNIYGVVFKDHGKIYYFNGRDLSIPNKVTVIVETERGLQFGKVVSKLEDSALFLSKLKGELKEIVRISTKKDYEVYLKNLKDGDEALKNAKSISSSLGLEMHFIDASFTFDKKQLLFNFYADERVDFRELAKKLASIYHTRIELRQVGARDKAENVGGIGICGRRLCCSNCLKSNEPVTINMAKNQNLALNPSKINGACGRLLCCLAFEDDDYISCMRGMPNVGNKVKTPYGDGVVISVDILNRRYKAYVNDELKEIYVDDDKRT
ncbi:MAG: stage 0 sporulation protein [Bacilli bacterium]|nr:stage 0 sporulation protein [Bacilli bacterium]